MQLLTIENGLVMNEALDGIPIERHVVTESGALHNVRTLLKLAGPIGVTVHNTGNATPTADARAHASYLQNVEDNDGLYVGAHFFVDAARIVQTLPVDEVSWHAGDGSGRGNRATISVEICETEPYEQCEANAMTLCAALLETYGLNDLYTHQMWSGKYCPHIILARGGWDDFVAGVAQVRAALTAPSMAAPVLDNVASVWAQEAVDWALANRFLVGDEKGDLRLHDACTREEVLVFLQRVCGKGA
ncbi:MAG: N-acetylmuramoyl-L-alanine amidase [Peptococcaceae bacterium]|nr:N-acetylmuramoyl-L-alanine amidase [Peptococcaceae bacterium]